MEKKFGLTHFNSKISLLDDYENKEWTVSDFNPRFSWSSTKTQWFVDQVNKMMLEQNPGWDPDGENGKGDAIGRSFISFFIYGDPRFLEGIENCWERVERRGWLKRLLFGKYYYQGYRYPVRYKKEVGLSRDHLIYTVLAFKYAGYSDEFIKDFVKHLRFRISDVTFMTIDLWLWLRVIANIQQYAVLYYPLQWLVITLNSMWNKCMYRKSGFGEESSQEDFIKIQNSFKPSSMVKMAKLFYPIYALHLHSWQIKLLSESKWKKRIEKASWSLCPKHNYAIQLLLDSPNKPTEEQVLSYKSMTGGRWTGILNSWLNDRDINVIKDPKRIEYNVLDVDYLRKLYYTIQCKTI